MRAAYPALINSSAADCHCERGALAAARIFHRHWTAPLDLGKTMQDGTRLLGSHKTWRGLIAAVVACALAAQLFGLGFALGAAFGGLAILGDASSSFLKRRLRRPPGAELPGIDQIPEIAVAAARHAAPTGTRAPRNRNHCCRIRGAGHRHYKNTPSVTTCGPIFVPCTRIATRQPDRSSIRMLSLSLVLQHLAGHSIDADLVRPAAHDARSIQGRKPAQLPKVPQAQRSEVAKTRLFGDFRVADPSKLQWPEGALWFEERPVDMIYNRLTDFKEYQSLAGGERE